MRGYELAEELDIDFGELKEQAEEEGMELGHHMSDVDEDVAEQLRQLLGDDGTEEALETETDETATDDTDDTTAEPEPAEEEQTETASESRETEQEEQEEQKEEETTSKSKRRMRKADLKRQKESDGGQTSSTTQTRKAPPTESTESEEADQEDAVELSPPIRLREVSEELGIPSNKLIKTLMYEDVMKTINDQLTAEDLEILDDLLDENIQIEEEKELEEEVIEELETDEEDPEELEPRAPVITVLGHVDHGKTSILDRIRETRVAAGEAGGITQKVGASRIQHEDGDIIFLDTPGHEAFTSMRARGANITDLAVLVVAADDGVMPQTKESVNHARAADVPIIVAINKIDKPNADPMRTRQQVSELDLIPEDWGGETVFVNTSAETGEGIDELLQMIILESELLELQANPDKKAKGACIESRMDKQQGVTTTLLVQEGTLKQGDVVLCGSTYGSVRALFDDRGNHIEEAGPSDPAVVLGLDDPPEAGVPFYVVDDEQDAQEIVEDRQDKSRQQSLDQQAKDQRAKLANILDGSSDEEKFVDLVVKAGTDGAAEVLVSSLEEMEQDKASVNILHHDVGNVTESDILLAEASDAIVLGFQTGVESRARDLAEQKNIEIRTYDVIYHLLEEIENALLGVLEPEQVRNKIGQLAVKEVFDISGVGTVAGCYVADGKITRDSIVEVYRNEEKIFEGELNSLKRFQEDRSEVSEGYECGVNIKGFDDVEVGDVIQAFEEEEVLRTTENV